MNFIKKLIFFILLVLCGISIFAQTTGFTTADNTGPGGGLVITGYTGTQRDIVIPDSIGGKRVAIIGTSALARKNLTSVVIPDSVDIIRDDAFTHNNLQRIILDKNIVLIGKGAFASNRLTSLVIPNSIITIDDFAFAYNLLTELNLGSGYKSIKANAFHGNMLKELTIGDMVDIDIGTFAYNPLERINI